MFLIVLNRMIYYISRSHHVSLRKISMYSYMYSKLYKILAQFKSKRNKIH